MEVRTMTDVYKQPTFGTFSNYLQSNGFEFVQFGQDGILLETELNELQQILTGKIRDKNYPFDIIRVSDFKMSDVAITYYNPVLVIDGSPYNLGEELTVTIVQDSKFAHLHCDVTFNITGSSTIKQYGNMMPATPTNTNKITDSRIGKETSRRAQFRYVVDYNTTNALYKKSFNLANVPVLCNNELHVLVGTDTLKPMLKTQTFTVRTTGITAIEGSKVYASYNVINPNGLDVAIHFTEARHVYIQNGTGHVKLTGDYLDTNKGGTINGKTSMIKPSDGTGQLRNIHVGTSTAPPNSLGIDGDIYFTKK